MVARGDRTFRQTDVSRLELGKVGLPHRERLALLSAVLGLATDDLVDAWAGSAPTTMPRQVPQQCKPMNQQAIAQPANPGLVAGSRDLDDALVTSSPAWRLGSTNWTKLLAESEEIRFTARHLRAQSQLRVEHAWRLHAEAASLLETWQSGRTDVRRAELPEVLSEATS